MTRNPGDTQWTDERLDAAYRELASRAVAPDLAGAVVAAIDAQGAREGRAARRPWTFAWRGPARVLSGLAAAVAVVCLVGAALFLRGSAGPGASPLPGGSKSPGHSVESLAVMTVAEATAAIGKGNLMSTDLLAVQGWLRGKLADIAPCTPRPDSPSPFEFTCASGLMTLTDTEGTGGLSLAARDLPGFAVPDWMKTAPESPVHVVLVGHVNDARASLCSAAAKAICEKQFVVDQVVIGDGSAVPVPSVSIISVDSATLRPVKPRMSRDDLLAALASVLGQRSSVISITAVTLLDAFQVYSPGLAPSGDGSQILWYVRVAGPAPLQPLMPGAHAGAGLVVIDDASGTLRGGAGWGWVASKAGIALPNGEVSLTTSNWLPGGACAGVGLGDTVLRGDASDPRVAWIEQHVALPEASPQDITVAVIFPAGYRAAFTPKLEILDENDKVVLRDGDPIQGTCGGDSSGVYLSPPFQ